MNIQQLEENLRRVMAEASRDPKSTSEKGLLEAALNVAEEWQMRLDEINAEDEE